MEVSLRHIWFGTSRRSNCSRACRIHRLEALVSRDGRISDRGLCIGENRLRDGVRRILPRIP